MVTANILDEIHDSLSPLIWDDPAGMAPTLKPQHKDWFESTIFGLLDDAGYDGMEKWLTLVFTGSHTTYQYSDRSDCDISLFVDTKQFPEWSRAEMIGIMVEGLDPLTLPGTPYPIQGFVVPPQIKPADVFKPELRSGYLIEEDHWINPPERERVMDIEKDMRDTYTFALFTADKMERLIKYEPEKAGMFWHQLHRRRRRDQIAGKGDFSPSNIAYKMIVNRGLTTDLEKILGVHIAL